MSYLNRLLLAGMLVTGGMLACPAWAAPAVKKLGDATSSNAYGSISRTTPVKLSTTNQRASSARALNLTAKPATKTTSVSKGVSITPKTSASGDAVRVPGLHGNLIKGISSKLSANSAGQQGGGDTTDLERRITSLEQEIVTKQDTLEAGDGIDITGNTISLSAEMSALPDKMAEMNQEISDLSEQIGTAPLPSDYYTADQTKEYLQQYYYTKQSVDDIVGALAGRDVADTFYPSIFDTDGQ